MLYFHGFFVALLIVCGQVLLKIGVEKFNFEFSKNFIFSNIFVKSLVDTYIILGVISYGLATLIFMFLLNKYQYTNLQAVVVSFSLFCTLMAATLIFNERLSTLNIVGFVVLVVGVILVTKF